MTATPPPVVALVTLSSNARAVARAMAVLWTWQTRASIQQLLRLLDLRSAASRAFTQDDVKIAQQELRHAGYLVDEGRRQGYTRLRDDARAELYREWLDGTPIVRLRAALHQTLGLDLGTRTYGWPLWDAAATVAFLRLELLTGIESSAVDELHRRIAGVHPWPELMAAAFTEAFDPAVFERLPPALRWDLAYAAVFGVCAQWRVDGLPVCDWALAKTESESGRAAMPVHLRLQLAELLLHRGEVARVEALLAGEHSGAADALRAAVLVHAGRWAEAQTAFEGAIKRRQGEVAARKRVLPETVAWMYPLCLLAQHTSKHLELARKFCLGESGSRKPSSWDAWGGWVHAISVRLGDVAIERGALKLHSHTTAYLDRADFWRCLLLAWLGAEASGKSGSDQSSSDRALIVGGLRRRLQACGFAWLDGQLAAAEAVLAGGESPPHFFIGGRQEAWREVLSLLQTLGDEVAGAKDERATRLVWSIELDRGGRIEVIEPMEQKRGTRGWTRPKSVPLARLAGNAKLDPWDAKVMQAVRQDRRYTRRYTLDRAAAISALIGHPAVVLAEAPETTVDVIEGMPELEVAREGERFVMRVTPAVRPKAAGDAHAYFVDAEEQREHEALREITVLRDSPQRIRVIRLTPAQRRAAQLMSGGLAVPAAGAVELQQALQTLAGHFQVQSDHAEAAREVSAESRLRAELAPVGERLLLRLVVAPLGPDGPRLRPGVGRARVMAAVKGESVGAMRDLAIEAAHLDAVLAALPFLEPPGKRDLVCEWVVDDPEEALGMVELLPTLAAVTAVDWPRGQAVRVVTIDAARLSVQVRTERDWFRLQGRADLDEGRVMALAELLETAGGRRFVPMGKGVYATLTRDLRQRLAELAAVAEPGRGGDLRVPQLAGAWLDKVLEGVPAETDAGFRGRVARLRAAQEAQPALPPGLQVELRPYQEDGYAWAMRLAQAGFGACLADDMGLGKTVQALAVLVARGGDGPALVVAPTSVCGNWLAEAQRFAPTLNPVVYGEGDRAGSIAAAGPRDLLIVSWTLLQQAQERFVARRWHTVVADEAQAVKNAAAKRALALFELEADFCLALSGTPVENRLAELWSIMRYCNPGLLGTLSRFNERFAAPIERTRDRDAQRMLRRLIAPFVLRRTKAEVLQELPPRTELTVSVVPDAAEAAHYEALRRQAVAVAQSAVGERGGQAQLNILAQLTRLRRAACDPRLVSPELGIAGAKLRVFAELATELVANGHKALVFSQFVDFLTLLRAPLDEAGIGYQYLDGSTPAAERTRRVAAFQAGESSLFLISLKAGGYGLNLTAADYVVITDPWWNPAAEDQAMGRAHRIGQLRPVTVYRLVAKGTLEERIIDLHHDKRALAEGVLADGGEGTALPTTDELIALLRGD